jgi:hypothetical protein
MVQAFRSACRSVNKADTTRHVGVEVLRHELETQDGARPVVTLFFSRRRLSTSWTSYFAALDSVTDLTVTTLARAIDT